MDMSELMHAPFLRFVIVGMINTLFSYSLYALLIYSGCYYPVAVLISTVCGILFSFNTLGRWVFQRGEGNLFWKFLLVYSVLYLVNVVFIQCGLYFSDNLYIIGAVATGFMALFSYFLNKHFVFAKEVA